MGVTMARIAASLAAPLSPAEDEAGDAMKATAPPAATAPIVRKRLLFNMAPHPRVGLV
ncbi:MAG TPA: hypothetical protein VH333_00480 [Pseudonocardiaceae bacterium]|nr:hypothetical protein [Pseudonocardiaceae bacterium]